MPNRSRPSQLKRQRERAKAEKRQQKMARRLEAKTHKTSMPTEWVLDPNEEIVTERDSSLLPDEAGSEASLSGSDK